MKKFLLSLFTVFAALGVYANEVVLDFSTEDGLTALGIATPDASNGTNFGTTVFTQDGVSISGVQSATTDTRVWNASGKYTFRTYAKNTVTIAVGEGATIQQIDFVGTKNTSSFTADSGSFSGSSTAASWTGDAQSVTFTATGSVTMTTITVTYTPAALPEAYKGVISDLTQLDGNTAYSIRTASNEGYLCYNESVAPQVAIVGATNSDNQTPANEAWTAAYDSTQLANAWQMVNYNGSYYLYNLGAQMYMAGPKSGSYYFTKYPVAIAIDAATNTYGTGFAFNGDPDKAETNYACVCLNNATAPVRWWTSDDHGSTMIIQTVDSLETIDLAAAVEKGLAQVERNTNLATLISTVQTAYDANSTYTTGDNLITSADQLSSEWTETSEGSLANLLDGDASTYWHSSWSGGSVAAGTHSLDVALISPVSGDVQITMTRRPSTNDHITQFLVQYQDAEGNYVDAGTVDFPYGSNTETLTGKFNLPVDASNLRFVINATTTGRGYGHMSEFQLNTVTLDATCINAQYATPAATLAAALATAKDIEDATEKNITTLQAAYDTYVLATTAEAMTIAEVRAAASGTSVKTAGTVTYVNGKNVYMQDTTSADLFYFTTAPDIKVGDYVTVTGTTTTYGGAPEVKDVALVTVADGTPVAAKTYTIAELIANKGLDHFGELVNVYNVYIKTWQTSKGETQPTVTDWAGNDALVYFNVDSTAYAFNTNVKVTNVIAGYYNKFEFVGSTENLTKYYEYPTTILAGETNLADWTRTFADESSTDGSFELNTWSSEADESGITTPFVQSWVWGGAGAQLSAMTIAHNQITGLTNGSYKVNLLVRAFNEQAGSATPSGITFTANGQTTDFSTIGTASSYNSMAELYGNIEIPVEVTDGTLDFSINIANPGLSWLAFKNFGLTYIAVEAPEVAAALGKMNTEIAAAQDAAIAAYAADPSTDNYNTAVAAVAAAQASVDYYAPFVTIISALDEAGAAKFAESEYAAQYENGTLDETTTTGITEALIAAEKAQTTPDSDLTLVVQNTKWTCEQGNGPGTYGDATETYNTSANVAGKVMYQHIEGLAPGTYTVQFLATANMAWIGAETGSGIAQIYANDSIQDIDVIGQTGCTPADYLRTITFTVGEDSVAEYGLQNIAQGGNWYVAKAISLTFNKAASKLIHTYYAYNNASATAPVYANAANYAKSVLSGEFVATFEEYNDKVIIKGFDGVEGNDLTLEWDDNGWTLINGEASPWIYCKDATYYGGWAYATDGYMSGTWSVEQGGGNFYIGGWFYDADNNAVWDYIQYTITDGEVFEYSADSYVGSYYEGKAVDVDLDAILASIGAASTSDVTIYSINNGTKTEGVRGTTDGWRNASGAFESWGTSAFYYLQDNTDLPGAEYWLGGYPGNTDTEASYTTQLIYENNTTGAQANVFITFNYIPVPDVSALTITDLGIETTVEFDFKGTGKDAEGTEVTVTGDESYTEKVATLTDEQVATICTELGIDDLSTAYYCGYNPTTETLVASYNQYDGWRDANGDFHAWDGGVEAPVCVKYADGTNYYCYNIEGCWQTVACYWAICNSEKAVLVKINFNYTNVPTAISSVSADNDAKVIYNLNGVRLNKVQKGINIINGKKVLVK